MLCQQTSPKRCANVNMTSYCDVTNSVYPVTMTTICHCSILEFGWWASNRAVAPGITRPLHATAAATTQLRNLITVTKVRKAASTLLTAVMIQGGTSASSLPTASLGMLSSVYKWRLFFIASHPVFGVKNKQYNMRIQQRQLVTVFFKTQHVNRPKPS